MCCMQELEMNYWREANKFGDKIKFYSVFEKGKKGISLVNLLTKSNYSEKRARFIW